MSFTLRAILIFVSALVLYLIARKIKKSELNISDSIFWLLFVGVLTLTALFPEIAYFGARLSGVENSSNFVFLCVIAALLIKSFIVTLKLSAQKNRLDALVEQLAIKEKLEREHDTTR